MGEPALTGAIHGSQYLEDGEAIVDLFRLLRDQRTRMSLQIPGSTEKNFTAHVLDIDGDSFLLDDVRPRNGYKELGEGQVFTLMGRTDGLYLFVSDISVRATKTERGVPYFEVPLPNKVLYQARRHGGSVRQSLRVAVAGATVSLYRAESEIKGRIIDISAGGCRTDLEPPFEPELDIDEVLQSCGIHVPHVLDVHTEAVVRYYSHSKRRGVVACGLEFTRMHVTDRRRLERFIQTIARSGRNVRP